MNFTSNFKFLGRIPISATSIRLFFAHPRWPTFLKLEGYGASGAAVSRWSAGCELWKLLTSSALDDGKLLCFLWWGDLCHLTHLETGEFCEVGFATLISQKDESRTNCILKLRETSVFYDFFFVSILMPHHKKSNCHATTHAPTFHGVKQNSVILPGGIRCIREVCLQMRVLQLFMCSSTLLTMRPRCPKTRSPKCDRWCPWTSSLVRSFVPWLAGSRRLVASGYD